MLPRGVENGDYSTPLFQAQLNTAIMRGLQTLDYKELVMAREGIMLCYPFDEHRLNKWAMSTDRVIVQPKLDGDRCRAEFNTVGKVHLLSSEGNEIESVPHIIKELESLNLCNIELDGELYNHNLNHEEIHGIVSRTVNLHESYKHAEYHIFDMINSKPQVSRLYDLVGTIPDSMTFVQVVPYNIVPPNIETIFEEFKAQIDTGYEGIIVRHPRALYERKRSTMIMKFKPKKSDYYRIVGSLEEISIEGKPKNALGALILESDDQQFKVGTGFTRDQRENLWKRREELPGLYAEVAYQHSTGARGVPRFPVFVSVMTLTSSMGLQSDASTKSDQQ